MNEAVTIRMTDTHVCLRVPFDLTQVCQSLRGRWNPEWKCWLWPKDKQPHGGTGRIRAARGAG